MPATWISSGQPTGGSGPYAPGTQGIQYIHDTFAVTGDTIVVPNGTYSWNTGITISKGIHLQAQTIGGATINSNMATGNMIYAVSGTDGNIEIFGLHLVQVANNTGGVGFLMSVDRTDTSGPPGINYTVLIHDCVFDNSAIFSHSVQVSANGIIVWNCTFIGSGNNGEGGLNCKCPKYGYTSSWNTPSTMGTLDTTGLKNTYVEDCTISNAPSSLIDCDDNSRVVIRHCTITDAGISSHGQETSIYGMRHFEVYSNTFKNVNAANLAFNYWVWLRGGTMVVYGNSFDLVPGKTTISISVYPIDRGMNDNSGGTFCATAPPTGYPAPRQAGWGWSASSGAYWGTGYDATNPGLLLGGVSPGAFLPDGTGAILDPIYIWGNTGTGAPESNPASLFSLNPYTDQCGHGLQISSFVQQNRDYYISSARPGWTAYTYPHPLRALATPPPLSRTPPKIRGYADHKPHSAADNKPKWGRSFDSYFDHFPVDQTDIFSKPNRLYINSYINHFARPGDITGGVMISPPAQAIAAGFSDLIFGDEFDTLDVGFGTTGHKWNAGLWYQSVPSASSFQANNSILTVTDTTGSGVNLCTQYHDASGGTQFLGGYLEARILAHCWSAFWLFQWNRPLVPVTAGNPLTYANEIDIMETDPGSPNTVWETLHFNTSGSGGIPDQQTSPNHSLVAGAPVIGGWHTYGVLWTQTTVAFYVDNILQLSFPPYSSTWQAVQLILGVGPGGVNGGASDVTPAYMLVDWVRVWH